MTLPHHQYTVSNYISGIRTPPESRQPQGFSIPLRNRLNRLSRLEMMSYRTSIHVR